jgi:hypothetical protein
VDEDGKAASPRPRTKKRRTFEDLVKEFPEIGEIMATQRAQAVVQQDLEARVGALEIAAPASMRAMSLEEIKAQIEGDFNFEFEVLELWGFLGEKFEPGRRVRASYYSQLLDFVRSGLKLGKPVDGGALNAAALDARIRAQARAAGRNGAH